MEYDTLKAGSLLKNGEYRIGKVLGQGGFGITYEAEQVSLGRKVSIKEFFMKDICNRDGTTPQVSVPSVGSQELVEKFRQKFLKEARMLAGFKQQHIVKVFDVFEENGTAYYVMEYLEGGSLQGMVRKSGRLKEREAIRYINEVGGALSYIHSKNTLHLDVKPGNIMLDTDGGAVLIDFGISKHFDSEGHLTSSTPIGVSKGYAPLEQVAQESSDKYSPATDIYSLGATMYFLLTGKQPYDASSILKGLPTEELKEAGASPTTVNAIRCAMKVDMADRPQSVKEFLNLLDGNAEDEEDTVLSGSKSNVNKVESTQHKSKVKKIKSDKKKPAESEKPKKQSNQKGSKEPEKKSFPKWSIVVTAGVAAILIAVTIAMLLLKVGKVSFDSEPRGAEVWIDGEASGRCTPCVLSGIPYGTHSFGYKLDGYCEYNDSISVSSRRTVEYFDSLKVAFGKLEVKCNQTGMEIFVDGVPTGKKTEKKAVVIDSVIVGTHKVELKLKQYKDCQLEVMVNENEISALTAKAEYDWPAPSGKENGHDYMDLGLSVKWATMNVGATSPEDYGDYFAWGETSPKSDYEWSNLKYCTGGEWGDSKYSKYVTDSEYGPVDNKTRLELSDDAARSNWGGSWRMPTDAEFQELIDNCTWTWTTMNGKNGYKVVSTVNGNSIFLPAAGRRCDTSLDRVGSWGFYWSSSLYESQLFCAHAFYFNSGKPITDYCDRRVGHSVRPVLR